MFVPQLYEKTESELVTQLNTVLGGNSLASPPVPAIADVLPLPENEGGFTSPTTKPSVTVGYNTSKFDESNTMSVTSGKETLVFDVVIQHRKLRGLGGIYDIIQIVKNVLHGFRPTLTTRVSISNTSIFQYDNKQNTWTYIVQAQCEVTTAPGVDQNDPDLAAHVTRITFQDVSPALDVDVVVPNSNSEASPPQ